MRPLMLLSRTRSMTRHFLLLLKPSTSRWPIAPFAKRYIKYIDTTKHCCTWYDLFLECHRNLLYLLRSVADRMRLCVSMILRVFPPGPCFLARWCAWLSWETWMQFCPTFRPSPWKQHFFRLFSGAKLNPATVKTSAASTLSQSQKFRLLVHNLDLQCECFCATAKKHSASKIKWHEDEDRQSHNS